MFKKGIKVIDTLPNCLRIILLIFVLACLVIGAYQMKIKKKKSKTEITIRMTLLLCFFAIIYFANEYLNDTDVLLIEFILLAIMLMVIIAIDRRQIKKLKHELRLAKRN